jgi:NADH-quinone oxidoreductase subunit L
MFQNSWLILLFPLLGFAITGIHRNQISGKVAGIIASVMVLSSFIYSAGLFYLIKQMENPSVTVNFFDWFHIGKLSLSFGFLIDPLSVTMMMIITGVGFLIHVFSAGYMHHDNRISTYFSQLNLFVFSMLILVMSSNYLLMFVGWEGVGLCSYLLIGFWYQKNAYNNAARKAFIMNRIGDLGFIIGLIALFKTFHTLDFNAVTLQTTQFSGGETIITFITLMLFVGAIGKSAQIPLFTWLPDAMAGPTPVSALIHAATMVTAGIYLVARSSSLFILAPITMNVILITGITTAIIAAIIALLQNDIKKVLAYSTVSQLGLMFVALGLGAFTTSVFHVTTHAFFKALLFLGAGSIIHALHGQQDIRLMGGIRKNLPITFITFLIAVLAISGMPPFSGFFSKDEILAAAFQSNPIIWVLVVITSILTCFYMFRLFFLVFFGSYRGDETTFNKIHESPRVMTIPLMILAILALTGGFLNIPAMFGGNENFADFLSPVVLLLSHPENVFINYTHEILLASLVLLLIIITIFISWFIYIKKSTLPKGDSERRNFITRFIFHKFYFDELYELLIVKPYHWLADKFVEFIETNIIDSIVNGFGTIVMFVGNKVKLLQNGSIGFYMFVMIIAMISMIACIIWIK